MTTKSKIRVTLLTAVLSTLCAFAEMTFVSTNVNTSAGQLILVGIARNGEAKQEQLSERLAKEINKLEECAKTEKTVRQFIPKYERRGGGRSCTVYCYNETDYSANAYFRSKKKRRKDWGQGRHGYGWTHKASIPAGADGDPTFSLRRRYRYQFYFTIPSLDATSSTSNEFKIKGRRKHPNLKFVVFYL